MWSIAHAQVYGRRRKQGQIIAMLFLELKVLIRWQLFYIDLASHLDTVPYRLSHIDCAVLLLSENCLAGTRPHCGQRHTTSSSVWWRLVGLGEENS